MNHYEKLDFFGEVCYNGRVGCWLFSLQGGDKMLIVELLLLILLLILISAIIFPGEDYSILGRKEVRTPDEVRRETEIRMPMNRC